MVLACELLITTPYLIRITPSRIVNIFKTYRNTTAKKLPLRDIYFFFFFFHISPFWWIQIEKKNLLCTNTKHEENRQKFCWCIVVIFNLFSEQIYDLSDGPLLLCLLFFIFLTNSHLVITLVLAMNKPMILLIYKTIDIY